MLELFIDLHTLRTKIKIRNTTTNNIEFFTLFNTNNKNVILIVKKKNGACVFWAPSIFLSIFKFFGGKITQLWTAITHSFEK